MTKLSQGKVTKTGTFKFGKNAEEVMKTKTVKVVDTDGTVVKAAYGATLSKNYNSCRVDVGIEYPTTKDNVKKAFQEAWELCGEEMSEQMQEAKEFLKHLG